MKKTLLLSIFSVFLFTMNLQAQCVASFTYNPVVPPQNVFSFVNTSTGIGPLIYSWSFGDGSTSSVPNPTHTYNGSGPYLVSLIIQDTANSCIDSANQVISVTSPSQIILQFFDDSLYYFCTVPASEDFYFYGYAGGFLSTDSIKFEVIFGDGTDSVFYQSADTANTSISGMFTHVFTNPGTYSPQIIMTGPNQQADTANANTIVVASNCGNVSGIVYNDLNNNCIYDAGDVLLPNVSVSIYNGSTFGGWASTDSLGAYSFNVPTGSTYTISVNAPGGYSMHLTSSCPPSGSLTVSSVPSTGNDFGLTCPQGFDLQGWVSGWGFRPGLTGSVCFYGFNQFCNTPNGQIELVFSSNVTPLPDSAGLGYTVNGNTVTLPINNPDLYWSFCVPVAVSVNSQIGDSVCIAMNITPTTGDSVPSNNTKTFCFPVRNSWDPNDKYTEPAGEGIQGLIRPNTDLTYTIRFQNTGNAEALNIYILDTLDANLDVSTIHVLASSHDMHYSLLTGNILRFNFDNINLPDSNFNEPASHGYVTYRISQKNNVPQLAEIHNSASIYFDFNPPIYTNQTLHTVDQFLAISKTQNVSSLLSVYPNPSNDKCKLFFKDQSFKKITVSDAMGKIVLTNSFRSDSYTLNTTGFPAGFYSIKILDENKTEGQTKLIVIH